MNKKRKALEMVLAVGYTSTESPTYKIIKEALAEPEPWTPDDMAYRPSGLSMNTEQDINPRPIGFWNGKETAYFEHELVYGCLPIGDCTIPLYAYPPTRKPLTEPELNAIEPTWPNEWNYDDVLAFARAIERAHGITND